MRLGGSDENLRPFWLHQGAEYLFGLLLVAQGLQSPSPAVPSLAGGLVLLNAALVNGPLGAFRAVTRPLHRWLDLGVMAILVVLAALPFLEVDNTSRILLVGIAAMMAFVWWNTRFTERVRRERDGSLGEHAAGLAGRAAGTAAKYVRNRRKPT